MTERELIERARDVTGEYRSSPDCVNGGVGAAILARSGNVYTGVCIDTSCSLGFCAEHSAVAEMLKHRESEIDTIVAVNKDGKIAAPCGRCRELIYQVNHSNLRSRVVLGEGLTVPIGDLLPFRWQESWA